MPTFDNYRPLLNLPPLAGLSSFPEAAVSGLGVQEVVDRLKRFHYSLQRVWKIYLARLTAEPVYELKMAWSHHAYLASEHITALRERVAEMRHPPLGLDRVPDPHLARFFDEILNAPTAYAVVKGLYGVALPALETAMQRHLEQSNPLADAPTLRVLRMALTEIGEMLHWGTQAILALAQNVPEAELSETTTWTDELQRWLAAAGQLDGTEDPEGLAALPDPRHSATPFDYAAFRSPRRDDRFPDPYNMGVHAEEFLYDEQFADKDKVLMMYYKRLREIDVPEMMASIIYELAEATGDEESGGKPWGFYRDLTRQLWDEARHAMMGEVGFAKLGIDWPNKVMVNFTWSKGLNEQLTPRERHAVLWFIEQGLMTKTGKRYEWEVGRESGDPLSALFQDYDWADEVLHARIGRDWYVKDFDDVKQAADYGSACWDKVVSDWEQWRKDGLTEHRNWWPDLYRAACEARGETPDAATLAYATSYATTRADLQRIAASG